MSCTSRLLNSTIVEGADGMLRRSTLLSCFGDGMVHTIGLAPSSGHNHRNTDIDSQDVISGRRLCAEWYAAFRTKDSTSNEQHTYFIGILEQVFDILKKEHKARRPKRKKKMPDLATDVNDLHNLYCHLGLDDATEEDDLPAGTPSKKGLPDEKSSTKAEASQEYDFEAPQDEKLFAVWSVLHDLQALREEVRATWQKYTSGDISFLAASTSTEDAMQVAGSLSYDLIAEYEDLSTYRAIIDMVGADWYLEELISDWNDDSASLDRNGATSELGYRLGSAPVAGSAKGEYTGHPTCARIADDL